MPCGSTTRHWWWSTSRTTSAPAVRAGGAGRRRGGGRAQPDRAPLLRSDPDPGPAPCRPSLVRFEPPRPRPVRDDRALLRRAGPVAGPLRAGHGGGRVPPRPRDRRRGPRAAQGLPVRDRFLFGVLRERLPNLHRAHRVPPRPRHLAPLLRRSRDRLLCRSAIDGAREGFESAVVEDGRRGIDLDGSLAAAWERMAAANVARVRAADL